MPESCPRNAGHEQPIGRICLHFDERFWGGISNSHVSGQDYTVSARERLAQGSPGWGVAARVNIGSDGSVIGRALQYDPGAGGYRDVDYPATTGRQHQVTPTPDGINSP